MNTCGVFDGWTLLETEEWKSCWWGEESGPEWGDGKRRLIGPRFGLENCPQEVDGKADR